MSVEMVLMRPGTLGGVTWTADVLRRDARLFARWPIFTPERAQARRLRDTMPRPVSDLAGEVLESWWDADQRAVVGRVRLVEWAESLVQRLTRLVRLLPVVEATSTRRAGGGVEAIGLVADPERGSFELTTAGPGRSEQARRLREAAEEENVGRTMTLGEALRTPEVVGFLREQLAPPRVSAFPPAHLIPEPPERARRRELREGAAARELAALDLRSDGQRTREATRAALMSGSPEREQQRRWLAERGIVQPGARA